MTVAKEEDKAVLKHFLNRTFFKDWSTPNNKDTKLFDSLELQLTSKCNLDCIYCYYNQYTGNGEDLNPNNIAKVKNILNNTDILLSYLKKNNLFPSKIDLFGGEPLTQNMTYEILDMLIDYYKHTDKKSVISIPSNMSFLRNDDKINKVIEYKEKAKKVGIHIGISASVDGKYMDKENRPVINIKNQEEKYNDEFYHKLFTFSKEVGCGFHPMIYYNNIENWIKNFNWFQEKFKEYDLNPFNIYLLEVRNNGWTKNSVKEYVKLYKYILEYAFKLLNNDKNLFIKGFVLNGIDNYPDINKMNMFNNIGTIGRGIGCSMQTTMSVRTGDLTVNSCHRQSYKTLNGWKFVKENNEIIDMEPLNLPYYLATFSLDVKSWPYCENCLIKNVCQGGCLGAQLEYTGDPFTPIPSVCLLEHGKIKAQIEFLKEHDMLEYFLMYMRPDVRQAFNKFNEYIIKGEDK